MKKILHLSDLHFGTEQPDLIQELLRDCHEIKPDIIVVSGDLTQRARNHQYAAVKKFLSQLPVKTLCVPGNHDISLYNPLKRFIYPFANYQKWISPELCASHIDDVVAILGINSVTPYKPMSGYVSEEQLMMAANFFKTQAKDAVKIVVMHHNLIKSERHRIINDADKILNIFADAGVSLVLSGHIHFACLEQIKENDAHKLYIITAGTAISTRTSAPNSYNLLEIKPNEFTLTVRSFQNGRFTNNESKTKPLR